MPEQLYTVDFTKNDLEVIIFWLEKSINSGHWGDGDVLSEDQVKLTDLFTKNSSPGLYHISKNLILQLIHDAEKCFKGKYGLFNPVGSVFEISALYKLNKAIGKDKEFLKNWEITEEKINSWLIEYS